MLDSVVDACVIYAHAISYMQGEDLGATTASILESIYFLVVFFFQSFPILYSQADSFELQSRNYARMILSTLTNWLDITLQRPIYILSYLKSPKHVAPLESGLAFRGLFHAYVLFNELIPSLKLMSLYL